VCATFAKTEIAALKVIIANSILENARKLLVTVIAIAKLIKRVNSPKTPQINIVKLHRVQLGKIVLIIPDVSNLSVLFAQTQVNVKVMLLLVPKWQFLLN
jgi:hypothetical protein